MVGEPAARVDGRHRLGDGRKPELVAAATDYVLAKGLVGLSLRPLAAALGISHRTLLYYFGSKDELLRAVLDEWRGRERRAIGEALADAERGGIGDALRTAWARRRAQMSGPWFRSYMHLQSMVIADPDVHRSLLDEMRTDWAMAITSHLERAGVAPDRVDATAALVYGAFGGLQINAWTSGDVERATAAFELLVELVERAVEMEGVT